MVEKVGETGRDNEDLEKQNILGFTISMMR